MPEAYVPEPSASSAPAVEATAERLARLRSEAQALCDALEYEACAAKLDEAKELDRDGEYRPDVIKMRHAIDDAHRKTPRLKP